MTPERWKQVSQVYESARARPASARAAFLDQACGGDEALREEVQALLDQPTSPPFLEGLTPSAVARAMRPTAGGDLAADFLETPVATLDPGMCLGQYAIGSLIGAGGMGEVYRATDTELGREVAVKVLPRAVIEDARWLARFDREAKTLAALNHPNIAAIYGVEKSGGITALVMELVEGPTLAERLLEGPVPFAEALPIARQIADALEAAHERGIVHRDLKPANVKLRPDGVLKVLDFGLAKMKGDACSLPPRPGRRLQPFCTNSPTSGSSHGTCRRRSERSCAGALNGISGPGFGTSAMPASKSRPHSR
jgi:serine/threonine-protein kinase